MHITHLLAENYKRINVVAFSPDGKLVDVVGRNGQGKSSLLDAVYAALGGGDAIPSKPIRKGADRARVEVSLGDGQKVELIVKRTFASKEDGGYTTSVVVEAPDGARYAKPQQLLDGLLGSLSFDPLAFTRMKPEEQLHELRKLVPGVDFEAIDAANLGDYQRRTDVNRQVKALKAQFAALVVPGDPRQTRVDETALVAQLEKAGEHNTEIERRKAGREKFADDLDAYRNTTGMKVEQCAEIEEQIAALNERLRALRTELDTRAEQAKVMQAKLDKADPLPEPIDTSTVKAAIAKARETNRAIDERERIQKERTDLEAKIKALDTQSAALSDAIEKRDHDKAAAVAAANLPVQGLTLGEDEVLLNGLPFDQASAAEKLRASVGIGSAMNSKVKIMLIRDASLLDEDGLRLIAELAEERGTQVFLERVANDTATGIVIEDGRVKVADTEEAAA